jgi:hypothetical protein
MSKSEIDYDSVYERWSECNKLESAMLTGMRNGAATAEGWGRYRDCQQFFTNAKKNYRQAMTILSVMQNNPKYHEKKHLPKLIKDGDAAMEVARGYSMLGILKS